jgi:hypothetical protein
MNRRRLFGALALLCLLAPAGCGGRPAGGGNTAASPEAARPVGPLPDNAYHAQLTVADPPTRLPAGQKVTVNVKARNVSDAPWPTQPPDVEGNKYVVAVMNSWLTPEGALVTDMDGRHGIPAEIPPGGEVELPIVITAPAKRGEYVLEFDMLQEQVTFFKDKGSETLKLKVRVE